MKQSAIFLTFFLMSLMVFAQASEKEWKKHHEKIEKSREKKSAELSLDTVFMNGEALYLFVEGKKMLGTATEVTVRELAGTDVMWCRWIQGAEIGRPDLQYAYEITFAASGQKALYPLVVGEQFYREIAKAGLFVQGHFQQNAEARFISFYPYRTGQGIQQNPVTLPASNQAQMVQRNRNAMIQVFGEEIKQDFKVVGYIRESTETGNGKVYKVLNVTLPNGSQAARAQSPDFGKSWSITTLYDRRSVDISTGMGSYKQEIATFLIGKMYL